jgi:putative ABC transport system ATP-binding protein
MTKLVLRASALTKAYWRDGGNRVTVLSGFDLDLAAGELVAVTGPSLSGKTTLVELLAGWTQPDSGVLVWDGGSTDPPAWSQLTVVPQGFALLEELTVAENIDFAARFNGATGRHHAQVERVGRVGALLTRLGLDRLQDRGSSEISVGERQRTMVARALVDRPALVLADEPVAHQDQRHATIVLDLLRDAVADGAACLVATRNLSVAAIADRVITLNLRSDACGR